MGVGGLHFGTISNFFLEWFVLGQIQLLVSKGEEETLKYYKATKSLLKNDILMNLGQGYQEHVD